MTTRRSSRRTAYLARWGEALIRAQRNGQITGALAASGFPSEAKGTRAVLLAFAQSAAVREVVRKHLNGDTP